MEEVEERAQKETMESTDAEYTAQSTTVEPDAPTSSSSSSSSVAATAEATPTNQYEYSEMVEIRVRPCAQAPALKKNILTLDRSKTIGQLERALKKMLKYEGSLFLYIGSGFAPTPDQTLDDLFACFSVRNILDIHYGFQEQWG